MYPYIVCFCGRPLGHLFPAFRALCERHRASPRAKEPIGYILDALRVNKPCCRLRLMTGAEFKDYYNTYNPIHNAPTIAIPDIGAKK